MEGQYIMPFVESRMWEGGAIDHGLVVSKSVANGMDRNTQVSESVPQVNNLFNTGPSRNEF